MSENEFHERILRGLEAVCRNQLEEIILLRQIAGLTKAPTGVQISQLKQGAPQMSITGTNAGGQSTFEADALLAGIADPDGFPAGSVDTWTTDDPLATVSPDSGPNESQVVVSVDSTDKAASYNLTVSVQMPTPPNGTPPAPLTATVNVPIIPAPPPVPTGVVINQIS